MSLRNRWWHFYLLLALLALAMLCGRQCGPQAGAAPADVLAKAPVAQQQPADGPKGWSVSFSFEAANRPTGLYSLETIEVPAERVGQMCVIWMSTDNNGSNWLDNFAEVISGALSVYFEGIENGEGGRWERTVRLGSQEIEFLLHVVNRISSLAGSGGVKCPPLPATETPTPNPSDTPEPTFTPTPTITSTATLTVTATITGTMTATPIVTPTVTATMTPPSPTATTVPTSSPTPPATSTPPGETMHEFCWKVNFDMSDGDTAKAGAYFLFKMEPDGNGFKPGAILDHTFMQEGWTHSDMSEGEWLRFYHPQVGPFWVSVYYLEVTEEELAAYDHVNGFDWINLWVTAGREFIRLDIVNYPDLNVSWLQAGKCHAIEVGWPE